MNLTRRLQSIYNSVKVVKGYVHDLESEIIKLKDEMGIELDNQVDEEEDETSDDEQPKQETFYRIMCENLFKKKRNPIWYNYLAKRWYSKPFPGVGGTMFNSRIDAEDALDDSFENLSDDFKGYGKPKVIKINEVTK